MNEDRQQEIRAFRDKWEDDNYSKLIDCPAHPGAHWAILYEEGHRFGGNWECPTAFEGQLEEHEHKDYGIELVEVNDSHPDRRDGYSYDIYVCGGPEGCGVAIDRDVADPAEDRADALADQQIMEELGK